MKRILLLSCAAVVLGAMPAFAADKNPVVVFDTALGSFKVELFADKAPNTVKNFLSYADDRFFDGTTFHRVIPNFMIQGGGYEPGMREKRTNPPIKNESANGLSNERGTVAMALKPGDPHSGTTQFFINLKHNDHLDRARSPDGFGYCVFGKVIEGMDVIDKIKAVETRTVGLHRDVPARDVVIRSVRREAK